MMAANTPLEIFSLHEVHFLYKWYVATLVGSVTTANPQAQAHVVSTASLYCDVIILNKST